MLGREPEIVDRRQSWRVAALSDNQSFLRRQICGDLASVLEQDVGIDRPVRVQRAMNLSHHGEGLWRDVIG